MKIIHRKRNFGKTMELIKYSSQTGYYIVCMRNNIDSVVELAKRFNYTIPYPLSYYEFLNISDKNIKFLIDDIEYLLLRINPEIKGFTCTEEENNEDEDIFLDKEYLYQSTFIFE